jgi:hypothetical protein
VTPPRSPKIRRRSDEALLIGSFLSSEFLPIPQQIWLLSTRHLDNDISIVSRQKCAASSTESELLVHNWTPWLCISGLKSNWLIVRVGRGCRCQNSLARFPWANNKAGYCCQSGHSISATTRVNCWSRRICFQGIYMCHSGPFQNQTISSNLICERRAPKNAPHYVSLGNPNFLEAN